METQWKHRSQKIKIFKINNKILQNFLKKYFKAKNIKTRKLSITEKDWKKVTQV